MTVTPKIVDTIEIEAHGKRKFSFKIDGQEFPWAVSEIAPAAPSGREGPAVTITIPCDKLKMLHNFIDETEAQS